MTADALLTLLALLGVGGLAGIAAGLFGIGGGLIMIPALVWLLPHLGARPEHAMHLAVGTSLATIAVSSLTATRAQHLRGAVRWDLWRMLAPVLALGAIGGALLGRALPGGALALAFTALTVVLAVWFVRGAPPPRHPPGDALLRALCLPIGGLAALVGVGGGLLSVPLLVARGVPLPIAVGTTSALTLPVSFAGGLGYALGAPDTLAGASGFVVWPAAGALALGAFSTARLGVAWSHALPVARLRAAFAVLLVVAALSTLLRFRGG
jgi:uncharacterized membrane protein YfcA